MPEKDLQPGKVGYIHVVRIKMRRKKRWFGKDYCKKCYRQIQIDCIFFELTIPSDPYGAWLVPFHWFHELCRHRFSPVRNQPSVYSAYEDEIKNVKT